jgi:hypothetical protein
MPIRIFHLGFKVYGTPVLMCTSRLDVNKRWFVQRETPDYHADSVTVCKYLKTRDVKA